MYRPLPWRDLDNPRLPPPRTSIAGTLKPNPPVFLAPGPVLGAQQFRSRPHPRARPCPRSLNVSISCFPSFFDPVHPIRPTLPVAHTIIPPCIALQRSQSPPPRPRTSLLRARHGGASKQQPKHTDPTSPPAAAVSSELRPAPKHHHINSPAAICAARPRPFPKPGPRRKGGPRRGNIGGAAHHHVPCPARLLLTRPRRGRRRQTRWSGTRCCRPLPNGPTSCP